MPLFGKSYRTLEKERDALRATIDARADAMTAQGVDIGRMVAELMPYTTQMERIKRGLRDLTPLTELEARRDALRRELDSLPEPGPEPTPERMQLVSRRMLLRNEAQEIDMYLNLTSRQKPGKTLLVFLAVLAVGFGVAFLAHWYRTA